MSERFDSHRERRIGIVCECGATTANLSGICDDCEEARWINSEFERRLAADNDAYERWMRERNIIATLFLASAFIFVLICIRSVLQ